MRTARAVFKAADKISRAVDMHDAIIGAQVRRLTMMGHDGIPLRHLNSTLHIARNHADWLEARLLYKEAMIATVEEEWAFRTQAVNW